MNLPAVLAEVILVAHLLYVGFVVIGELLILAGAALGWRWVRNVPFRFIHLIAILIVAVEALWDIRCPLWTWESDLRVAAGQEAAEGTFVENLVGLFIVHDWPAWVFTLQHVSFAVLVVLTFLLIPPRRRRD